MADVLGKEPDIMKASSGFISLCLVFALVFGFGAGSSETDTEVRKALSAETDGKSGFFLAMTERTSKSLTFPPQDNRITC